MLSSVGKEVRMKTRLVEHLANSMKMSKWLLVPYESQNANVNSHVHSYLPIEGKMSHDNLVE